MTMSHDSGDDNDNYVYCDFHDVRNRDADDGENHDDGEDGDDGDGSGDDDTGAHDDGVLSCRNPEDNGPIKIMVLTLTLTIR